MPTHVRACAKLFALSLLILSSVLGNGQSAPAMKSYRVLRSISGTSGHEDNGRYIMDDPRSVFVAGKDAKVTIYFEWEGPTGPHHFEGLWKSPEGKNSPYLGFPVRSKSVAVQRLLVHVAF